MPNDRRSFVGVDLGGTNVMAGVVDPAARVLARNKVKTKPEDGPDAVVERVVDSIRTALAKSGVKPGSIGGVGVGAPGAVDVASGVVVNAVNLRWNNFPLARKLSKALDMPVVVDNDVNVGTWGEYRAGAARGCEDVLGVFVGTGIGGGLVLGGKLFHGQFGSAGEIGHIAIRADAPLGRRTLENLASRTAVANLIANLIRANHDSKIVELVKGDLSAIRSKVIATAIRQGDELATEVVSAAANYVGIAIANVVTLLSLPCVVVGGGMASALGAPYVGWVRKSFEKHVFPHELRACKLVAARLGDDAGLVGAALWARETARRRK